MAAAKKKGKHRIQNDIKHKKERKHRIQNDIKQPAVEVGRPAVAERKGVPKQNQRICTKNGPVRSGDNILLGGGRRHGL